MPLPLGPQVDSWPRPLPLRQKFQGQRVTLEPLARRHAPDLFEAAQFDAESFTYVSASPWQSVAATEAFIATHHADPTRVCWAIRPVTSGRVSGMISLINIEPANAAIEIGGVWFGPELRRTRAATEAVFMLLRHVADDLGYRRLVWTCDALNAASRRAALRFGFIYEGTLHAHMVRKGHQRDTASYAMLAKDWPNRRAALLAWLDEANFDAEGTARQSLQDIRLAQDITRIRPRQSEDQGWIKELLTLRWGSPMMAVAGELIDLLHADALVADTHEGLLTYRRAGDILEILSFDTTHQGVGLGTALLAALKTQARAQGITRLRVITTNDNLAAQRFYQSRGFYLTELRQNAVAQARLQKPEIPLHGAFNIPLRDELVLVCAL